MATEIKLPELGENVEGGDVVDVKVTAGTEVREGQALLEVEADKATVEVPSPGAGRISKVLVKKGDKVQAGQVLFLIESSGAATPAEKPAAKPPAPAKPPPEPAKPQAAAKPPPESPKPQTAPKPPTPAKPPAAPPADHPHVVPAGPATRRLARELGIDLARVPGSAPGGRVSQDDVKAFVRGLAAHTPAEAATPSLPDFGKWGAIERQPLDTVRRKTASQMALAWSLIPHVTQHDVADITDLESFRKQQDGRGPKLTVTAFALKAAAIVLKEFPQFNATLDLANQQLIVKQYYHLGLAVDTERGLLVPVLRDVDRKSVHALAGEMAELAEKARQKKLGADDMKGGTFTITNLGGIGGTGFTPIVNWPEVAILGLSRSRVQPVWRDGGAVGRLVLPLSLSYDHRVIDGAAAARFVRRIAEMLENPLVMLLHV
jgi:pyruvate dehydrogenase E2 component (dihydrolipoamide acetyltransferase)